MKLNNSLGLIEKTPLIELQNISNGNGKIYAKAEFIQPGGSIKDRAAFHIIKDAYKFGKLKKGQPVVEMTSGNMGSGLAVVCNIYGNPFTAVMSEGNSHARAKMLKSFGANVVLVPQVDGSAGQVTGNDINAATEKAITLAQESNAFYVDQFNNYSSVSAHFKGTGPELWDDIGDELTAFVAAVGSGGTYVGTSKFLKKQKQNIICAAVEPAGAEILAGKPIISPKHNMQGIGYCINVPHWEEELVDHYLAVNNEEATCYRKLLAEKEGLYVGFSAAANVCAAVKLIENGLAGASPTVATVLCDTGLKY